MAMPEIKRITCEHLLELEKKGPQEKEHVVVDIRDFADYETGHIEGSVHIPRRELADNLPNLVPVMDKRVVVILGPTEEEEIEAVHEHLRGIGYRQIEYLAGGIDHYCRIADVTLEDVAVEATDEESGFRGDGDGDIDPENEDNVPLY
jgi:rhodanese-related sulfurtransferase